jgi:hypothetical protein
MATVTWLHSKFNDLLNSLFQLTTKQYSSVHIVRFALIWLDLWQVIALYYNDTIVKTLIGTDISRYIYLPSLLVLAILSVLSLRSLSLALVVISLNIIEFMYLTVLALIRSTEIEPIFSAGVFLFALIVCIGAFWKILLMRLQDTQH